jgi:UDP-glucose 4-epimerase
VGESVSDPTKYYRNNVSKSIRFLNILMECGVTRLVFSSTAAVYGEPERVPLTEDAPLCPVNPYGRTKRMIEQVLADYDRAYSFRSVSLRYFNAGGAHFSCGESHRPESHLIPCIIDAAVRGDAVSVYGDDYPTRDGSCIRDYIHVRDLADAHILAARYLLHGGGTDAFNLGTGRGFTVFEVISAAERIIGRPIGRSAASRRSGDSPSLVASAEKAHRVLGWGDCLSGLDEIIESAYTWRLSHPGGYGEYHD